MSLRNFLTNVSLILTVMAVATPTRSVIHDRSTRRNASSGSWTRSSWCWCLGCR
jgi:hypothetical protein